MFIKEKVTACEVVHKGCSELGVEGDVIVPDVSPDILKVIQLDGDAVITSNNTEDGKLNCEGKVFVKILYIPEGTETEVKSIITSFDFSHIMSNQLITADTISDLSVDVSRMDFQLINSRKLKIKAVVSLCYEIMKPEDLELACSADCTLEMKKNQVTLLDFVDFKDTQFLVRDSLELPSGQESINEILKVDVSVSSVEKKVITGRIIIKGVCDVCILYKDLSSNIRYSIFEMPFTEIMEMEDVSEDSMCDCEIKAGDVNYHIENDSDGESRIIYTEIILNAKFYCYNSKEIEYIEDCFCPGCDIEIDKEMKSLDGITASCSSNISLREVIEPTAGMPTAKCVYNMITKTVIESAVSDKDKVSIDGKIICYCLYISDSEDMPLCSIKKEIPFCETIMADGANKGDDCRVGTEISHKSYGVNSAGEIDIKIVLQVDIILLHKFNINLLSNYEIKERNSKKGIVIYFTQSGDNMWEISKKYRVEAEKIKAVNKLDDAEPTQGMKLLIPSI